MYISYSQPSSIKNFKEILNLCTGFKNFSDAPCMTLVRHVMSTRIADNAVVNVVQPQTEVYWFVKARTLVDKNAIRHIHENPKAGWQQTNMTALAEFPDVIGYKLLLSIMELSDKFHMIGNIDDFMDRTAVNDALDGLIDLCRATSEVVYSVVAAAKDTIEGYDDRIYFFDKEERDRELHADDLSVDQIREALDLAREVNND